MQIVKLSNGERNRKRQKQKDFPTYLTPEKYLNKESMYRKVHRLQKKFGYDYGSATYESTRKSNYEPNRQFKTIKHMKQDFLNKTLGYFGKGLWTNKLGRKQKYQKNIEFDHPLKKNPLIKIFDRIQNKIKFTRKLIALQALKEVLKN